MGLSQSLYTGWSGLSTHQKSMDNIGNNLANVNTVGYKKSEYLFSSLFSKAISGAAPADGDRSTTNAKNVGMGTSTGAIVGDFKTGSLESTSNPLDCALDGNGFFIVSKGTGTALTRNGSFYLDHAGASSGRILSAGDGMAVQGWMATNGVVNTTRPVGNILLPAVGDLLPGAATSDVTLRGNLPTNTASPDFDGNATLNLELMGNLTSGGSLSTSIFAAVTQTDGATTSVKDEVREIPVRIDFIGPELSADGTVNNWTWTMTTVDWPNPGDPGVQIYPTPENPSFTSGQMQFHAGGSLSAGHGEGEAVLDRIYPGTTDVKAVTTGEGGSAVTTSFSLPADFTLDISHMSNLADPPVGGGPAVWYADGNPAGTMARTINVFDEYTDFEEVEDASGNTTMQAVRRVETRQNTLYFTRAETSGEGSVWTWKSSLDGGAGELKFNTSGELAESSQSGGGIAYNFGEVLSVNQDGSLQATGQDGFRDGFLLEYTIDQDGKIWGTYSNQTSHQLAQLAIGTVANPNGLISGSGSLFYPSDGISGALVIGVAGGMTGAGNVRSNMLESSNVDLAREFSSLISTERGYQFNSRIVSTSNEMLQTALQLKQ